MRTAPFCLLAPGVGRSSTGPWNEKYHFTDSNKASSEYCVVFRLSMPDLSERFSSGATCADLGRFSDEDIKSDEANACFSPPIHQEDTGMGSTVREEH